MHNFLKGVVHFSLLSFGLTTLVCLPTFSRIDTPSKEVKRKPMLVAYFLTRRWFSRRLADAKCTEPSDKESRERSELRR
jgi:hypothetical protein